MNSAFVRSALVILLACVASANGAGDASQNSPQAASRTYAQNYRDMVLLTCLANAYEGSPGAAGDAGSSVSALRDWTYFDLEKSPSAVNQLVNSYLARDYQNPIVESEVKGVRFDALKCLDLYHSKDLDTLVRKLVIRPHRTYRQEHPPMRAR